MGRPVLRLSRDTAGVSPVIGTVLVLAISVLGVAGILAWGAPTIDRIQTRNSQVAMEGEFEGLRDASQELSVPDHSRFPTIAMPAGTLAVQKGTRFLVTSDHDPSNPSCDFRVTKWADTASINSVATSSSGCRGGSTLEIYSVGGTTTVKQTITSGGDGSQVLAAGTDFTKGDWMFRLTHAGCPANVCAEAWLHSSDQLAWSLKASTGSRELFLDGGAVFSRSDGTFFLEKEATIGDTSFGGGYYGLWLRSLLATSYTSIEGQGSRQVFLSLLGNSVRTDSSVVTKLRLDFSGTLAQAWCNAMVLRDPRLIDSTGKFTAVYKADTAATCATGDANGVRSICYTQFAATTSTAAINPCTASGTAFQLRFLHARIDTSLSV
ncbi:MAG TPA: hypothetical protein VM286_06825 [Candidatus Thermoplasmatota archaeon]|nr:hypothetical protein [Candidatus Thermoplasmatota archaeon]